MGDELMGRWAALIDEAGELRRRLGIKPWQFQAWADYDNPHAFGSAAHAAFETVRERGIEIERALEELRPQLYQEMGCSNE